MYPYFIEVEIRNGPKAIINIDNIKAVSPHPESMDNTYIYYSVGGKEIVSESYDEVKQLITDSGCLIAKADPRLDTTTPLTMDDLKGMIGEPVWNSNNRQWLLVFNVLVGDVHAQFYNKNGYSVEMTAEDLVKYPLYRMKQDTLIDKLREVRGEK